MKRTGVLIGVLLASIGAGFLLLVATWYIPADLIRSNIAKDVTVMAQEGPYPKNKGEAISNTQDGYTDAIMLSMAIPMPAEGAIKQSAVSSWWEKAGASSPVESLYRRVMENPTEQATRYPIYWNGYAGPLRLLLTTFSYTQIRVIDALFLFGLLIFFAYQLWRRLSPFAALALVLGFAPLSFLTIPESMQFMNTFIIAFVGACIVLALAPKRSLRSFDLELFLGLGIATAYFDFLTTPLITWGIPLLVVLALSLHEEDSIASAQPSRSLTNSAITFARASGMWLVGYVCMWASKWVIAYVGGEPTMVGGVSSKLLERTGSTGAMALSDRFSVLFTNLALLAAPKNLDTLNIAWVPVIITLLLFVVWGAFVLVTRTQLARVVRYTPLLAVAMAPYVWYLVVANHSANHYFFTFRTQFVATFALILFFLCSLDWTTLFPKTPAKMPSKTVAKRKRKH